jgi:hypothetical protein
MLLVLILHVKTKGLLEKISDYMDRKVERKTKENLHKRLENMNVEATDIVKLLNQTNNSNTNDNS